MQFLSFIGQNCFKFVCRECSCVHFECSLSDSQDAVQLHCYTPFCSSAQPAHWNQSCQMLSNVPWATTLEYKLMAHRLKPEAQFKFFKLGQVRGKARIMVTTPLEEQGHSAVACGHMAVDACRAGSCFSWQQIMLFIVITDNHRITEQ